MVRAPHPRIRLCHVEVTMETDSHLHLLPWEQRSNDVAIRKQEECVCHFKVRVGILAFLYMATLIRLLSMSLGTLVCVHAETFSCNCLKWTRIERQRPFAWKIVSHAFRMWGSGAAGRCEEAHDNAICPCTWKIHHDQAIAHFEWSEMSLFFIQSIVICVAQL